MPRGRWKRWGIDADETDINVTDQPMTRDDFRFFWPFRVRYSEIDGQGIVFNAHYLTYFDTSITEYIRWLPFPYGLGGIPDSDDDFHIVKTIVEYRAPIRFDDDIEVGVRTGRIGRSSLTFDLGIFHRGGGENLATGEVIWVNTNQTTGKSTPLPGGLVEVIRSREGARLAE